MSFDWSTADLPKPSVDFGGEVETSVIRSKMESGRVRQRRRFTSGIQTLTIQWLFDDAEYALFAGIFQHKLSGGADWFLNLPLAIGESIDNYTARFVGQFSHSYVGHLQHRVRARVEIEIVSPLSESEVDAIITPP